MRAAVYARVSTTRQAQAQGIEQQLDRLRDHAALADLDVVVVAAPDRLARNYVHQVLLIDELAGRGCQVEFLDRPMSADPHDQLLLQIRGAVAEYERTLIAERMRRGRQASLRAGTLLPWTTAPFGYRLDPERPRRADAVRTEPGEVAPARGRKSAMLPAGPGVSHAPRPEEDWITVPVPAIVSEEAFAQVQAKLDANQQTAARNTRHEYLLRALISCGACRLTCGVRQTAPGYHYYQCRGRT